MTLPRELIRANDFIGVVSGHALSQDYIVAAQDANGYRMMYAGYRLSNLLKSIYSTSDGFLQ